MSVANQRIQRSIVTVSNSTELAARIVRELAGSDIANSIGNNSLTYGALCAMIKARIRHNLSKAQVEKI